MQKEIERKKSTKKKERKKERNKEKRKKGKKLGKVKLFQHNARRQLTHMGSFTKDFNHVFSHLQKMSS